MIGRHRGPKGLEFAGEIRGRMIAGDRQCPHCHARRFALTGRWRLITTKSGGHSLRRIEVRCLECGHAWYSGRDRVRQLAGMM